MSLTIKPEWPTTERTLGSAKSRFLQHQADIDVSPEQQFGETRPGDIKYKDQNGDGIIDSNDEVFLGRWDTPFRLDSTSVSGANLHSSPWPMVSMVEME